MKKRYRHIRMEKKIESYIRQLDHFYYSHGVEINWRKVKYIRIVHDHRFLARYHKIKHYIEINDCLDYYKSEKVYHKAMMVILAHEIGHSQGLEHSDDPNNIMYYSDQYTLRLLKDCKLSEMLLTPYRENAYKS